MFLHRSGQSQAPFFPRYFALLAGSCLLVSGVFCLIHPTAHAESANHLTADVRITVTPSHLHETLPIPSAQKQVTMSFRDVAVEDALRALAKKGGFNVLIDESVKGTISVDLNNVSIQDALESIKTYGNLAYSVENGNLMVSEANSENGQAFKKSTTRIFPLKNTNPRVIADLLNQTLFSDRTTGSSSSSASSGSSGSSSASSLPVTPDFQTNSLIVVGTPADIKTVAEHLEALDQPRHVKTWRLSQANVLDVATILSSSLFNEGRPAIVSSGSSSSSSGSGGAQNSSPSALRVTAENITEGTGTSQASQSGGSGSSGGTALVNNVTLRAKVKQTQTIQISPTGPILIPDTRLNTLTLLGTAEQIAMAESMLSMLDRKIPQVVLEASLIEISQNGRQELGFSSGFNGGFFSGGTNNLSSGGALVNRAFSGLVGRPTSTSTPLESILRFSTNSTTRVHDFMYQINALVSKNKAKILANPTVITTSDNESIISIVDEIISSVSVTVGTNGGATTTATNNIGEAGIVLNLLPRVGADGSISLRVRPIVSTVASTQTDRFGNLVTLLSKREILAQNTVLHDGESFILGGLLQDTNTQAVSRNPLLSNLPILGALARNSTNSKTRTELVILITPHILSDESAVTRSNPMVSRSQLIPATLAQQPQSAGDNAILPVSLTPTLKTHPVLPPLEPVHTLGSPQSTLHSQTALQQPTNATQNTPTPSSQRLYQAPHHEAQNTASSALRHTQQNETVSEEEIQAIMQKFSAQ